MKPFALLLLILFSSVLSAQTAGIPNRYMNDPAVDLVKGSAILMPDEAHELVAKSKGRFDLSTLDPDQTSDLWKNSYPKELKLDQIPIQDLDEVVYHSPVLSPSGIFRFNIQNNGDGRLYTMMLSKTVHSVLLAKSLLRKIGYQIPDINYLPRVMIKFKNEKEKKGFISYLENVAFAGASKYWIVDEEEDKLLLQDLVVMDSNNSIYNLAVGVTSDMIQGRRLLSSLAVPLSIVNLTESVNMLRWNSGVLTNNQVVLFHDRLEDFQCTWEDARWISRRIAKLTRDDWKQIVESTNIPKSVQMILLEKILSRRNSVMKLFKIDAETLKVDSDISNGVELVKGKLTQEEWPGYASRFAYGDPESPLSASEIKSWVKSKAISLAIDLAVSQLNQRPFMGTDIQEMNNEKFQEVLKDELEKAILEQRPATIPLKAWTFPTLKGEVILNRNLVTGTYLGTDNLIQLVDTVGVSLSAGIFAGSSGLPEPIQAYGAAEGTITRTYSHLRPVTSMQKAMKYPFKNIFIPLVKFDYGKKLHEAATISFNEDVSDETRIAKIEEILKPFKDTIAVGESMIVTDTLSTGAGLQVAYGAEDIFKAALSLVPGHVIISRFHVHRKSEDEFHIYKDLGHEGSFGSGIGINSYIPIGSIGHKKAGGHARVKFYSLNLNPKNPDVVKHASYLRRAIIISSTSELDDEEKLKPLVLKHSFSESNPQANFLFWQWKWLKSSTEFTVVHPKGDKRYFRRQYLGSTKGRNYQAYVENSVTHWIDIFLDRKAAISDGSGSNPGYSFKGSAKTKFLTLDEELDQNGNLKSSFININRIQNGWSIDRASAEKILEEMTAHYRFEFYNAPVLNDTRRIFLYNISVNLLFYQAAIDHLLSLDEKSIKNIFVENQSQRNLTINPAETNEGSTKVSKFLRYLKRYKKYVKKGKFEKANKYLLKACSTAEEDLNLNGLTLLSGGEDNISFSSKINGFREGDEDGDRLIISSSLGEFGSSHILGPVNQIQRESQMLEGEFFIYWLMTRLI